jgi:bifunctional non-homologous end joining protein LigD
LTPIMAAPTVAAMQILIGALVYEEKVDGWRMLGYKDRERVRLVSRNGINHTKRFPDLATAIAKLTVRTLVLDGEVAIFNQQLRSRFDWLREPDPAAVATPPVYIAFDLMFRDGGILPRYRYRLGESISWTPLTALTSCHVRRLAANGLDAWAQVVGTGYEGSVAKEEASEYRGGTTRAWLKVKVPGWTDSEDRWKRVRLS